MLNKESIKDVLLNLGSVKFEYREKVEKGGSDVGIYSYKSSYQNERYIYIDYLGLKFKFSGIDLAVDRFYDFIFSDKNIAYVFAEAMENLKIIDYDGDPVDTKEIYKEIKRIRKANDKNS